MSSKPTHPCPHLAAFVQVSTNIAVLNALRLHPMARALHDVAVTYLLTEAHSGYNMPWMAHNLAPPGLLGGPPRHEAHHRTGAPYYHQFFCYLDDAFAGAARRATPPRAPARG